MCDTLILKKHWKSIFAISGVVVFTSVVIFYCSKKYGNSEKILYKLIPDKDDEYTRDDDGDDDRDNRKEMMEMMEMMKKKVILMMYN